MSTDIQSGNALSVLWTYVNVVRKDQQEIRILKDDVLNREVNPVVCGHRDCGVLGMHLDVVNGKHLV